MKRRIYGWFFGPADMDDQYNSKGSDPIVVFIIEALKIILASRPSSKEDCADPLKIIQQFFRDHENLIEIILKGISYDIVRYIYKNGYLSMSNASSEQREIAEKLRESGKVLMGCIPSYFGLLLKTVIGAIKNEPEKNLPELVNVLRFVYETWLCSEELLEPAKCRDYQKQLFTGLMGLVITKPLGEIVDWHIENFDTKLAVVDYSLKLAENILTGLKMVDVDTTKAAGAGLLETVGLVRSEWAVKQLGTQIDQQATAQGEDQSKNSLNEFNQMDLLGDKKKSESCSHSDYSEDSEEEHSSIVKNFVEMMIEFEKKSIEVCEVYSTIDIVDEQVIYTNKLGQKIEIDEIFPEKLASIFKNILKIVTTQQPFIHRGKELGASKASQAPERVPKWLTSMANCIKSNEPNVCNSAIEGTIYIISSERKSQVYKELKTLLLKEVRIGGMDEAPTMGQSEQDALLKSRITAEGFGSDETSNTGEILILVIDKLWHLLDHHEFEEMALKMLLDIMEFTPYQVCNSIIATLSDKNMGQKEKAFQRFSTFWKLTTEKTVKVNSTISKTGLFKMLDF